MVAGMAIVTFGIRYVMFPVSGRIKFSPLFERSLGYVPPAVLSAIIVPSVLMPDGKILNLTYTNPYIIGAAAACVVGWLYKKLLVTIMISMTVFMTYQWILTLL
ncbi:MAG: AzlD domain-containing protein [Desulfamplus sp.]|nr:AzlD domain-containing protein [Desulfamplus sp.]MBF0259645.1 AzlD domain-containing protein [Desulfamplus sp.]